PECRRHPPTIWDSPPVSQIVSRRRREGPESPYVPCVHEAFGGERHSPPGYCTSSESSGPFLSYRTTAGGARHPHCPPYLLSSPHRCRADCNTPRKYQDHGP